VIVWPHFLKAVVQTGENGMKLGSAFGQKQTSSSARISKSVTFPLTSLASTCTRKIITAAWSHWSPSR